MRRALSYNGSSPHSRNGPGLRGRGCTQPGVYSKRRSLTRTTNADGAAGRNKSSACTRPPKSAWRTALDTTRTETSAEASPFDVKSMLYGRPYGLRFGQLSPIRQAYATMDVVHRPPHNAPSALPDRERAAQKPPTNRNRRRPRLDGPLECHDPHLAPAA